MSYTNRIPTLLLLVWGLAIAGAACGFNEPLPSAPMTPDELDPRPEEPPIVEPPPPPTARERLAGGLLVELDSASSAISVVVAKSGELGESQEVPAIQGTLFVRVASDALSPSSLAVEIADIEVAKSSFPPDGLRLTNIHASASFAAMRTVWADERGASFDGEANVRVEWSLVTDNGVLEVRPLEIERLAIGGELEIGADDRITLALRGTAPGLLLDVGGVAQMSDLSLQLEWTEPTTAP